MKKNIKLLICVVFLSSNLSYATDTMDSTDSTSSNSTTTSAPAGTGAASVNNSANTSKSQNNSGSMLSKITGGILAAMAVRAAASCPFGGQCPMAPVYAGMAALSFMQAGDHSGAADTAFNTALDTNANGTLGGTTTSSPLSTEIAGNIKTLEKGLNGVKANFKTGQITGADGKNYSASDFSSPSSMSKAGLSSDQVSNAMAFADKASQKAESKLGAMTAANGFQEGGGGGGGFGSSSSGDSSSGDASMASLKSGGIDREPAQLAGMQKDYNGEPIGVAGDSIFAMMNRRYKFKDKQNAFIDENELLLLIHK